jgi:hypothetical protein
MLSHAGDNAIESCCNDVAKATWPRCDVDASDAGDDIAESCWQWCCNLRLHYLWQGCAAPELGALRCCRIMKKSDIRVGS